MSDRTSVKDNPPAFPRSVWTDGPDGMKAEAFNNGMTLRDYFAGQALAGLIHHYQSDEAISSDPLPDLSRTAYDYADVMLKIRSL